MSFFDWIEERLRGDPEADEARRLKLQLKATAQRKADKRAKLDLAALAQGGLPVTAKQRLKELGARADDPASLFTSNLSPAEAALLRRNGWRPRGLVMGSAMYHVGQPSIPDFGDGEIDTISHAFNEATRLAVGRLQQELELLGAHGVIAVRLALARHLWGDRSVEVKVLGTAVEGPGAKPERPWVCDLSGQEWWALHRAGYEPCALVWGHCSWFCFTNFGDEVALQGWTNQELKHFSLALSEARYVAMSRIMEQAIEAGAEGVTGVRVERRLNEVRMAGGPGIGEAASREHHALLLSITGTAIRERADAPTHVPQTHLVLSLRDGLVWGDGMVGSSEERLPDEL